VSEHYIGGFHAIMATLEDGSQKPVEIYLADTRQDERARRLIAAARGLSIPVRILGRGDLDLKLPGFRHQGAIALMAEAAELAGDDLLDAPSSENRLFLVLDGVQDPHNLGACLRTAEAAGVSAVIVPKDRAAGLSPVARKVAAGAAERVPLIAVTNLSRTLERMRERGYWISGLDGEAEVDLFDADLSGPRVLVMGAEGQGMRRLTREHCDQLLRIPMFGKIESLNVSVAAGVCLYEAVRQRR